MDHFEDLGTFLYFLVDINFVRLYMEGGRVYLHMYACVFRGREGQKFHFSGVRNIWIYGIFI